MNTIYTSHYETNHVLGKWQINQSINQPWIYIAHKRKASNALKCTPLNLKFEAEGLENLETSKMRSVNMIKQYFNETAVKLKAAVPWCERTPSALAATDQ